MKSLGEPLSMSLGHHVQSSYFTVEVRPREAILDKWGAEPTPIPSCKSLRAVEVDGLCLSPQAEGTQQTAMSFLFQETSHLKVL